jgi:hypothetical protein
VGAVLMLAACSSPAHSAQGSPNSAGGTHRPTANATVHPSPPPVPAVHVSQFRAADGAAITLARFTGPVTYKLHSGSEDPGAAALSQVRAGPTVSGPEASQLLAAFNGGFLLAASAGGYEQEGHVISPLRAGLASLVIDSSGTGHIGVWGAGLPQPGENVFSVRQNLGLLVSYGQQTTASGDWGLWGATLGGGEAVARSALGQDAAGSLIYAGSMAATPSDLAAALVSAGARTAMELDINPEWVQLDVARAPGWPLQAAIPGQVRPADQYMIGWTRDFITVLG